MFPTVKESLFAGLTGLIKSLLQQPNPTDVSNLITQIYREMETLEEEDGGRGPLHPQMEEYAIDLWNWGVTKRGEEAITEMERSMVRHVACNLACWCEGSNQLETTLERNVLMAMKTGKGWIDVGKPERATVFLETSLNSLEKLYSMKTQRSPQETDVNAHKHWVEAEIFKVLTYQAEAAVAQKDFQIALARILRCKDMLLMQPNKAPLLSILCYNCGVEMYEGKEYEQSTFWLRQSYDIGKADLRYTTGNEMQAKVLRLLATVYLEWDCKLYQDKALNAVGLANETDLHPAGLFLKMKILLSCSLPDNVISMAAAEMLRHDLSLEVYLNTVKLLMQHNRDCVGFDFLKMVCDHFESTPDIEKVRLLEIELLTTRGKELLARKKIEDLITGHYTGKPLSADALDGLHVIFWDCATKSFEKKSYSEALEWYNYSLGICASDCTDPHYAKLQRNRATCLLHLNQLSQAREAVSESEKCDPDNILTHYILFRIAVQENRELEALNGVSAMGKAAAQTDDRMVIVGRRYSATDLLSMAAKIALENNQQKAAVKALECVMQQSPDTQQVFLSLRCLVRLALKEEPEDQGGRDQNTEAMMSYINIAHEKLAEHLAWSGLYEKRIEEAHWFRKVAWNVAVGARERPLLMRDSFLLSYKISVFCPCDKTVLVAQKSCLLMAAAVDLEMARQAAEHSEKVKFLAHSLESITLCWEIWNNMKSTGEFSSDNSETLLVLYEFEARAKLNDPALESVLEYVWGLPNLDAKILESIAYLSMESPAYYPSICKKALQGALSVLKKEDPLDVSRLSKCLHSLVKLSLPERLVKLEDGEQEEAWNYYQEALCIITSAKDYPEIEILWLMTRAWNHGIFQYSFKKLPDTSRWCALAMRLLNYLGSLKGSYESKRWLCVKIPEILRPAPSATNNHATFKVTEIPFLMLGLNFSKSSSPHL